MTHREQWRHTEQNYISPGSRVRSVEKYKSGNDSFEFDRYLFILNIYIFGSFFRCPSYFVTRHKVAELQTLIRARTLAPTQ